MSKYIVDILDKDKYALEIGITKNGSIASQRVLDAVKDGIPYEERPHGEWRLNEDGNYECSECGIAWKDIPIKDAKPAFKACPWCGIEMREGEAE